MAPGRTQSGSPGKAEAALRGRPRERAELRRREAMDRLARGDGRAAVNGVLLGIQGELAKRRRNDPEASLRIDEDMVTTLLTLAARIPVHVPAARAEVASVEL